MHGTNIWRDTYKIDKLNKFTKEKDKLNNCYDTSIH